MVNKWLSLYSSHFIDEYKGPTSRRQSVFFFREREWGWIEDERNKGRKTLTYVPISLPMSLGSQGTLLWWWTIWYWLAFEQGFCRSLGVGWDGGGAQLQIAWSQARNLSSSHFIHILIFSSPCESNIFQFITILHIPSLNKRHQLQARVDKIQCFVLNCPPEPRPHSHVCGKGLLSLFRITVKKLE